MKGRVTRLAIVAVAVAAWAVGHTATASACGVERWNVKTLQDPAADEVNFTPTTTTVDSLRNLAVPVHIGDHTPRLTGVERQTFKVKAQLVAMTVEDDGDVHLVIAAPRHRLHTMIVEFP